MSLSALRIFLLLLMATSYGVARPGVTYKIFQFPADRIPRVDGDASDWNMVPESYAIGSDQLQDTAHNRGPWTQKDKQDIDVRVRVGWVRGMNRLYFLYEADDNYWDFTRPDLHNDIFEVVVDGDLSGGPLIAQMHPNKTLDRWDAHFLFHGIHAQNYHAFTPAVGKDWALAWGCQPWIKDLPWSNAAYSYNFKPGESGHLTLEFWITPFDFASCEGPSHSVESKLYENKRIGLSWAILDYDDVDAKTHTGFWNLSDQHTMYGNASFALPFQLMPLEPEFRKKIDADWSFVVADPKRRLVVFRDESVGQIQSWRWDFGDGTESTEENPIHTYEKAGQYIVTLYVEGPAGKSRRAKIWDVTLK